MLLIWICLESEFLCVSRELGSRFLFIPDYAISIGHFDLHLELSYFPSGRKKFKDVNVGFQ